MGFNDINLQVSGPQQPASTYKTKVLKGNHSFAPQVAEPNTKYVIKHNFDLGGEAVTIPENCVLEFDGGSLKNGTVTGNNTSINAGLVKILGTDVTLAGTWNVAEVYPEWFGAKGDGVTDDKPAFNKVASLMSLGGKKLVIPDKVYAIRQRVSFVNVINAEIVNNGIVKPIDGERTVLGTFFFQNCKNIIAKNLCFNGNVDNLPAAVQMGMESLVEITYSENITFDNLKIYDTVGCGVTGEGVKNIKFTNVYLSNIGEHGFYFGGDACKNIYIENLHVEDIGTQDLHSERLTAVVKCRFHEVSAIFHDNFVINNFYFKDSSTTGSYQLRKCLFNALDIRNWKISNGILVGDNVFVTDINELVDNGIIDNINLNGRGVCAAFSNKYGTNNGETIDDADKGSLHMICQNSTIKIKGDTAFTSYDYYNCNITLTTILTDNLQASKKTQLTIDGGTFDFGNYRIDLYTISNVYLRNLKIIGTGNSVKFKTFTNISVELTNVNDAMTAGEINFVSKNENSLTYKFTAYNSTVFSRLDNANSVNLVNSIYKFQVAKISGPTTIRALNVRGLYNARLDYGVYYDTIGSTSHNVTFDLRQKSIKGLTLDDIIVTPLEGGVVTTTISNNIVTVSTTDISSRERIRLIVLPMM